MSTSVLEVGAIGVGTDNEALRLKTPNTLRWATRGTTLKLLKATESRVFLQITILISV